MSRRIKVVLAKMGLDSHYRGAIMVARHLSSRGMEVVYLGNQLAEGICEAAVQEDADVLGLSSLSGSHMLMVPRILQGLRVRGATNILVLLGGVVPGDDARALADQGIARFFGTGSNLDQIADFIEEAIAESWVSRGGAAVARE